MWDSCLASGLPLKRTLRLAKHERIQTWSQWFKEGRPQVRNRLHEEYSFYSPKRVRRHLIKMKLFKSSLPLMKDLVASDT